MKQKLFFLWMRVRCELSLGPVYRLKLWSMRRHYGAFDPFEYYDSK